MREALASGALSSTHMSAYAWGAIVERAASVLSLGLQTYYSVLQRTNAYFSPSDNRTVLTNDRKEEIRQAGSQNRGATRHKEKASETLTCWVSQA
jgi:hypothetical protein